MADILAALGRDAGRTPAALTCFRLGYGLLTLSLPASFLIPVAQARNGSCTGPVGTQWVAVLFGYWMACVITGTVLVSWLTGQIK